MDHPFVLGALITGVVLVAGALIDALFPTKTPSTDDASEEVPETTVSNEIEIATRHFVKYTKRNRFVVSLYSDHAVLKTYPRKGRIPLSTHRAEIEDSLEPFRHFADVMQAA